MMIDVTVDRDKYIGGSDLPTILGWNKQYGKSIVEFAKEKLNIVEKKIKSTPYTDYGHIMEPHMRDYMNAMFDFSFKEDSVVDEKRKYRGNCDGIDREKGALLECKTFGDKLKVDYYTPQCQFYMELFDIDVCYLVGYRRPKNFYTGIDYNLENDISYFDTTFDEKNIVIYKLERDREMFKSLEVEIDKFKYLLNCLKEDEIINGKYGVTSKVQ